MEAFGYKNPKYANSFEEFGEPVNLPNSKSWILKRKIPNFPYFDAMGCYPLFCCQHWPGLYDDLENLNEEIISLITITDPFGDFDTDLLKKCFKDVVIHYKDNYIIDLNQNKHDFVSKGHRKNSKKGLKRVTVEVINNPMKYLVEWEFLYDILIKRHDIKGMEAFSHQVFKRQFEVPGFVLFRAVCNNETIGLNSWYVDEDIGYAHLAAYNEVAYQNYASYALFWFIIDYFKEKGLHWLALGGSAGMNKDVENGLSHFKKGWSTGAKPVYLCGRIFDKSKYTELTKARNIEDTNYFPAYRKGEFV